MKSGEQYGRLTVIKILPGRKALCQCNCGNTTEVFTTNIRRRIPNTRSCGCLHRELAAKQATKHGLLYQYRSEYRSWSMMKNRCSNPNADQWEYYGGLGISVCNRWLNDFEAFLTDMGPKPDPDYCINRIDNDGDYEPVNCEWTTRKDQCSNRSIRRWYKRPY